MFINNLGIAGRVVNTPVRAATRNGHTIVTIHIKNDMIKEGTLQILIFGALAERVVGTLSGVPIRKGAVVYFEGMLKESGADGRLEMKCDKYIVQSSAPRSADEDDDVPY